MSNTEGDRDPDPQIPILYGDQHLCLVNKPAGIPVQPDRTGDRSVIEILRKSIGKEIHLVHRLDRPVSGVLLFALDPTTLRTMNEQFRQRQVHKIYWAIVEGSWDPDQKLLEHRLTHDARSKKARLADPIGDEKIAKLQVELLAKGDRYSLLKVIPEGGQFHQIRAQLAAAGHAIKGDVKYGARRGEKDRSIALHARSIAFHHPATDRKMDVIAPPPAAPLWAALLAQ